MASSRLPPPHVSAPRHRDGPMQCKRGGRALRDGALVPRERMAQIRGWRRRELDHHDGVADVEPADTLHSDLNPAAVAEAVCALHVQHELGRRQHLRRGKGRWGEACADSVVGSEGLEPPCEPRAAPPLQELRRVQYLKDPRDAKSSRERGGPSARRPPAKKKGLEPRVCTAWPCVCFPAVGLHPRRARRRGAGRSPHASSAAAA